MQFTSRFNDHRHFDRLTQPFRMLHINIQIIFSVIVATVHLDNLKLCERHEFRKVPNNSWWCCSPRAHTDTETYFNWIFCLFFFYQNCQDNIIFFHHNYYNWNILLSIIPDDAIMTELLCKLLLIASIPKSILIIIYILISFRRLLI